MDNCAGKGKEESTSFYFLSVNFLIASSYLLTFLRLKGSNLYMEEQEYYVLDNLALMNILAVLVFVPGVD